MHRAALSASAEQLGDMACIKAASQSHYPTVVLLNDADPALHNLEEEAR